MSLALARRGTLAAIRAAAELEPSALAGLYGWWDAQWWDDNTSAADGDYTANVSGTPAWADLSGAGNTLLRESPTAVNETPVFRDNVQNGRAALEFGAGGLTSRLTRGFGSSVAGSPALGDRPFTGFVVVHRFDPQNTGYPFPFTIGSDAVASTRQTVFYGSPSPNYSLAFAQRDGSGIYSVESGLAMTAVVVGRHNGNGVFDAWVNSTPVPTANRYGTPGAVSLDFSRLAVGGLRADGGQPFRGYIFEAGIWDQAHSDADILKVIARLRSRWAI